MDTLSRPGQRWHLPISLGGTEISALIDTGSSISLISAEFLNKWAPKGATQKITPIQVTLANGCQETIAQSVKWPLAAGRRTIEVTLYVLEGLSSPVILGIEAIRKLELVIFANADQYAFADQPSVTYAFQPTEREGSCALAGIQTLDAKQNRVLEEIIRRASAQDLSEGSVSITHNIEVGDAEPIKQRPHPVSPKVLTEIHSEVDRLLREGIVVPSRSPWSSPVVMVRKPDGSFRFCIDFRKVNAVTRKDAYPLPLMTSLLDGLQKAKYLSKIDLKEAYLQIPLHPDCQEITAFSVPGKGHYHFTRMAYGLTNAPASFQRLIDSIIDPSMAPYCFAYLDDILIATPDFALHLHYLELVLTRLREAGLRINRDKCEFGCRELRYLGFIVDGEGMRTDPDKTSCIQEYPTPRTVKSLRRFLGICSWYRRFVPDLATLSEPLNALLKKKRKWGWGDAQEKAFQALKEKLTSAPLLARPQFDYPFVLQTDASSTGVGAVLGQVIDSKEQVIAYASRTLTSAERKYSVTERECLAVVWAVQKFRPYIEGYSFTVVTDHSSLRWLQNLKNPTGRLARWALELQAWDFKLEYRPGAAHHVPDALSRLNEDENDYDERLPDVESLQQAVGITNHVCDVETPMSQTHEPTDPWYRNKKQNAIRHPDTNPDWRVEQGELYVHRFNPALEGLDEPGGSWKLVVPKTQRQYIISENHDRPECGHLGTSKTYDRIARAYFWPGMFRDIYHYVKRCGSCQRHKYDQQRPAGLMNPRRTAGPWEVISTDLLGPYPRSSLGHKYILIFQDQFTKWLEVIPLRAATGKVIADQVRKIIYRWGVPKILLSDRGTPFLNKTLTELAETYQFHCEYTPPYHPQANFVERANRTIKPMLTTFVDENQRDWDRYLAEFMYALNSSKQESTGYSPAFLNFGRELPQPDTWRERVAHTLPSKTETPQQWARRFEILSNVRAQAEANLAQASDRQASNYNRTRRKVTFQENDLVLRRVHTLSSAVKHYSAKLGPRFEGPFKIDKVLSSTVYQLATMRGKKVGKWHISKLRPYYPSPDPPIPSS